MTMKKRTLPTEQNGIIKQLLAGRDIEKNDEIFNFFYQDIYTLSNPFAIQDVDVAVRRIREAVEQNERILIYGDKDVDGISATALVYKTLTKISKHVLYYIPDLETGYGLSKEVLTRFVREEQVSLVITVDCGISNVDEIAYLREEGVDTIITDHHDVPPELPNAYAMYNPKLPHTGFPQESLCGVAVAFKIMQALVFSYSAYYNADFIVVDFGHTTARADILTHIKAVRIRNFIIDTVNTFSCELKGDGMYTVGAGDETFSIVDVLEEFASFAVDNDETYIVVTGGESRLQKILATFNHYDVYTPPYKEVFDLLALGARYAGIDMRMVRTFDAFIDALSVNPFSREEDHPLHEMFLRADAFVKLFLMSQSNIVSYYERMLPFVALGTVADIVPIKGENRTMVRLGLDAMRKGLLPGITAFCEKAGVTLTNISARDLGWRVNPALNSTGRLGHPDYALRLLVEDDTDAAKTIVDAIREFDTKRRAKTDENIGTVKTIIEGVERGDDEPLIIVKSDEIDQGLTGLIAGRISRQYGVPAIIVYENKETGECVGSSRSEGTDNVRELIEASKHILVKYGGHTNASGFTLPAEHFEEFAKICRKKAEKIFKGDKEVAMKYDMRLSFQVIDLPFVETLELLEPFGWKNEEPLFFTEHVEVLGVKPMGKNGNHLQLTLQEEGRVLKGVLWRANEATIQEVTEAAKIHIIYTLHVNRFNGSVEPRVDVKDYKVVTG